MGRAVIILLTVGLVVSCQATVAGDDVKDEVKKLQGDWPITVEEVGGDDILNPSGNPKLVFDGETLIFKIKGGGVKYTAKLHPSASPKAADLTFLEGKLKGQVVPAVYQIDTDELWLCLGRPGHARPDGFATRGFTDRTLIKCKRPKVPDKDTVKEMKMLAGTWKAVAAEYAGKPYPEFFAKKLKYVISDDKIICTWNGSEATHKFELDLSAKPRAIKGVQFEGDTPTRPWHGVYQLDKDELTICVDHASMPRPTTFETKPKSQTTLYKFKREKP